MPGPNKGQKMTKIKRPIRICGDVAYVPLTQGYEAIIDAADVPLVDGFNWHAAVQEHAVYACNIDRSGEKPRAIYLHRLIIGAPKGIRVDHLNGDGLYNRIDNLRLATAAQNSQNRRINVSSTSGLKGVSFEKRSGKWVARIGVNHKSNFLGYFNSAQDAYGAYCVASEKFHGEFGRTS
tara:strand:- start:431 stop:967 length:537 start_codon:yes stop_codon:yes gene_type:complete